MEYGTLVVFGAVGKPELPAYTTSIAAAWGVVDKTDDALVLEIIRDPLDGLWQVALYDRDDDAKVWLGHADTAPEAISLAALRARGLDL